ncbi:MAG: sugar phosphate isomerase/epimerase [Lentisphaerae bacterium]|nr:sugar phosphate isomerase/epimerase [Lentisphaerota bacterium]
MPTITACATLGYAGCDLTTALDAIAALGFTNVEISEMGAYCRHFPYRETNARAVGEQLAERGLTPVALNVSFSRLVNGRISRPALSDPEHSRDIISQAHWFLEQARALNIGIVTMPIGPRILEEDWNAAMKASCAVWRTVAGMAADLGVGLNLEVPHLYQLIDTVAHVKAVFEEIAHPALGATVDSSHWGIIGYDLDSFFDWLAPRLRHVHLRDSAGGDTRDFQQDLERTPGQGSVDFTAFGRALDRAQFQGHIALELEHRHADRARADREFDFGMRHLGKCGFALPPEVARRLGSWQCSPPLGCMGCIVRQANGLQHDNPG